MTRVGPGPPASPIVPRRPAADGVVLSTAMARSSDVRLGAERVRVGPWRGSDHIGLINPIGGQRPPSEALVLEACRVLAERGYHEALTGALAPDERRGFVAA